MKPSLLIVEDDEATLAFLAENLSADGFRVATATDVQRAACRVRDGLPLDDLRDVPAVVEAFGGDAAVSRLASEHGHKPQFFYLIASPRTDGSPGGTAGSGGPMVWI